MASKVMFLLAFLLGAIMVESQAAASVPLFAQTPSFSTLNDKTLVVWCSLSNLDQQSGGTLCIEGESQFDGIVFGEIAPGKWMAGSELYKRSQMDQSNWALEQAGPEELVQIAAVYQGGQVRLYRNGQLYAAYPIAAPAEFGGSSNILFGLRHKAAGGMGGNAFFAGAIHEARIYSTSLSEEVLRSLRMDAPSEPAPLGMWTFQDGSTTDAMGVFPDGVLHGGARVEDGKLLLDGKDDYMITPVQMRFDKTLHFRPDSGVVGDIIPFYWKGVYHVFYLKGAGWGHLTSQDLVRWEELPDALEKGPDGAPDAENCWTGSIVEKNGVFHLFYTGKNSLDPKGDQKVMQATSTDLIVWAKRPEDTFYADGTIYWSKSVNGPIDDKQIYHHQAFRDPDVIWNEAESRWWMLLHAVKADGSMPVFARYVSDDLLQWKPCEPLYVYPKEFSGDCPQMFFEQGKWHIIAADHHYTWADAPGGPYQSTMQPFDCGELFVPKSTSDGKRRILLGWIGDREGNRDSGKGVWGGVMSMARELYADAQGRLCQRPAREVMEAYNRPVLALPDDGIPLERLSVPRDYMLHTTLASKTSQAKAVFHLRQPDEERSSGYRLAIDFDSKEIVLGDNYRSYKRVCDFDAAQPVDVRVFVIGTVIECFINNQYCFTMRAYDYADEGLSMESEGAEIAIRGFAVSGLKSLE